MGGKVHVGSGQAGLLQDDCGQEVDAVDEGEEVDLGGRVEHVEPLASEDVVDEGLEVHGEGAHAGDHDVAHQDEGDVLRDLLEGRPEVQVQVFLHDVHQPRDRVRRVLPPSYRVQDGEDDARDGVRGQHERKLVEELAVEGLGHGVPPLFLQDVAVVQEALLVHLLQGLQLLHVLGVVLLQLAQLLLPLVALPQPALHEAQQPRDSAHAALGALDLALHSLPLLLDLQHVVLVLLYLLYYEVDLVLHLLLCMQDLEPLLLVYQVVEDVGEPNGAVGRHQRHQVDAVLDDQLDEDFELQLLRSQLFPSSIHLPVEKEEIGKAEKDAQDGYLPSSEAMVDEGQPEDEAERDDDFAHGDEYGEDEVPI